MPWNSLKDVPNNIKKHQGVPLTLAQANRWAELYDGIKSSGSVSNSAAAAIAWDQWKKEYKKKPDNSGWVKR